MSIKKKIRPILNFDSVNFVPISENAWEKFSSASAKSSSSVKE